jgi:hypothetical protein
MLKLLEEPAEYAHYFLIIPSAHLLLPTVKSRMSVIDLSVGKATTLKCSEDAKTFLKSPVAKRLDIVKKLVDEISKEKKTKKGAIDFVNAVQEVIYSNNKSKDGLIKSETAFKAIEIARSYLNDRAPSVKMLLEYVALNV